MLTKNESALDRVVRTALGGGLLIVSATSLGVTSGKPLGIVAAAVGAILLFTAVFAAMPASMGRRTASSALSRGSDVNAIHL